ncbi:hypothetical protein PRIPAC_84258, partial [Pristionchus pacificus]
HFVMFSFLNLAELPIEILLDIFGQVDRDETKPFESIEWAEDCSYRNIGLLRRKPIRTTLRLVCRRFNNIITDPTNQRRLSAIRMRVEMIAIAQLGSDFEIRVFPETSYEETACPPEISALHRREDTLVRWAREELTNCRKMWPCGGSEELFEKFTHIISQFEPRRLELARIDITRSFMESLIECLRGYPRIQCIKFALKKKACMTNFQDYLENLNIIESQFNKDIDIGIMAKFASNFHSLIRIQKRFVTSEFIEIWTTGPDTGGFDFFEPIEHNEELTSISLFNFHRFSFFESAKLLTTIGELINAIERRIKIGKFKWQILLSDDEREIRRFTQNNHLNYRAVERFHENDNREAFRLMKLHKFNGVEYAVIILIAWSQHSGCYNAGCLNEVDIFSAEPFLTFQQ